MYDGSYEKACEYISKLRLNRREFIKTSVKMASLAAVTAAQSACSVRRWTGGSAPRVAIVGGGVAGLHAAYILSKGGVEADIYESSSRIGGRMYSATGLMGNGLVTELGGEFIDSTHTDILNLVNEFGLDLMDTEGESERGLIDSLYFNGSRYTEAQIIDEFMPIASKIAQDYESAGEIVNYKNEGGVKDLDNLSLEEYLDRIGASGAARKLIEIAYLTEYGLDIGEQSALNLIFLISTDVSEGTLELYGDSDERFKVRGGNDLVVKGLYNAINQRAELDHRLEALAFDGREYILNFSLKSGAAKMVRADYVIMTVPFSVLRSIRIDLDLPSVKQRAIQELGYGTNAKLFAGFTKPKWREWGFKGDAYSDVGFQLCWDNSRMQGHKIAAMTLYSGGEEGIRVGEGTPESQVKRLLPGVNKVFPGIQDFYNGKTGRFHWPTHPHTLGSYSCYMPGQWTTIAGAEGESVGRLLFAGEHCSYEFQGFMNGAAETGREAAEKILRAGT